MNSPINSSLNFQTGILQPVPVVARYLTFTVRDAASVRTSLRALSGLVDGVRCVVGVGQSLVDALDASLDGLRASPAISGTGVHVPTTPGALWCWLRGDDRGKLFVDSRAICKQLATAFDPLNAIDAFKYDNGRDLTGYEDGTENPKDEAAVAAAFVAGRGHGLDGSSFVAVQQWLHDLNQFDALTAGEQDNSVGRRRSDNEELASAPESAHVKRTAQESFSPEAFVLRRSMPWSNETQAGLLFTAFGNSFAAFEAQMRRMAGLDDGVTDALFRFTRPITGNYYWCPPMREGRLDLSAIGL